MENILSALQKVNHGITVWPGNSTPKYTPKRIKTHAQTLVCLLFLCSWKHYSLYPQVKKNTKSINWWMHKENVMYPYNGILFSNRKQWSTDTGYNTDEAWKYKCESKTLSQRSQSQNVTSCSTSLVTRVRQIKVISHPSAHLCEMSRRDKYIQETDQWLPEGGK